MIYHRPIVGYWIPLQSQASLNTTQPYGNRRWCRWSLHTAKKREEYQVETTMLCRTKCSQRTKPDAKESFTVALRTEQAKSIIVRKGCSTAKRHRKSASSTDRRTCKRLRYKVAKETAGLRKQEHSQNPSVITAGSRYNSS